MVEKVIRYPGHTIRDLIKARKDELKRRASTSGTVQHDSDLDQAVDKFHECISDKEALKKEKKAIKEAEENEKKMSDSVRDNLLL
jgi:hypothetical protein